MRNKCKIVVSIIIALFIILICNVSKANSIDDLSMDIYIMDNGDAKVTEIWKCYTNTGTEVYHPYYNLGNSEIKNLKVSDEKNQYLNIGHWYTEENFNYKKNKCGFNKLNNGIEICWGISEYGDKIYKVEYTITNFVSQLNDSQMAYWTLIPYDFSSIIGNAYIKIHSNKYFNKDLPVWGYGNYGGTAYVYDGYIEMQPDGSLGSKEYMTILIKFPKDMFDTENKLNHNFEYYLNMANEGSKAYNKDKKSIFNIIGALFVSLINFFPFIIMIFVGLIGNAQRFNYGDLGKKMPKDVPYYRDIPCNKNIYRIYYVAEKYGLLKKKTDFLGSIILKWLKESLIRIEKNEDGVFIKKTETIIVVDIEKMKLIDNSFERQLFKMLYDASLDGKLENKEFEKWCKNHYSKILNWFDSILKEEEIKLKKEGLIEEEESKIFIFKSKRLKATKELKDKAIEIEGLKRFLMDYTLIKDREACEVQLFEEYLIIAQMLGIANQVAKDFKEIYPDIIEQSNFYSYDNIVFIQTCSNRGITYANSARDRANAYSSGGGGFSSGGGGGGSFGGGGGGGGFR